MIKLEDYIFNIEKLFSITNDIDKKFIQSLYHELLGEYRNSTNGNNVELFKNIFNTLYYGGFLINKLLLDREKVLESLDV